MATLVGRKFKTAQTVYDLNENVYIGEALNSRLGRTPFEIINPVENGRVTDWEVMEKLWDHCFLNELKCDSTGMKILLTEKPKNPRKNREMMAELMFEYFKVDNLYIALQFVLALYSSGRTTGVSCDIGEGTTCVAPIVEGYPIQEAVRKVNLGGKDITD